MRSKITLLVFLIHFSILLNMNIIISTYGQCLDDQRSLLLQFKDNLLFDSSLSTKLVKWNQSVDCCRWSGVDCDKDGHVIGLDLNSESINGGISDSSSVFNLRYLQVLNLADNYFDTQLPSGFGKLVYMAVLNLSNTNFAGQIPLEFSHMTRLVSLHLSGTSSSPLNLEYPNLKMLIRNFTELRELYLDGISISTQGYDWSRVISFYLPDLRALSLSNCNLSGPIDSSFLKLQHLSVICLDENPFSSPVPEFFSRFSNLTFLSLRSCNFSGTFPDLIFQISTLQTINLGNNRLLEGSLPEFPRNGSLQNLHLDYTMFSGKLPNSIGDLKMLSRIELRSCNFTGPIPKSMANLTQLLYLDFSINCFTGSLPPLSLSKNLKELNFHQNSLTGEIPSSYREGFKNLESLYLSDNVLSGSIPISLFSLPALTSLDLSNNQFSGRIKEFVSGTPSPLSSLHLSGNKLEGPIPKFLFQLQDLMGLSLSSNNFNGSVELSMFENLGNLRSLDLSHNNLSISTQTGSSTFSSLPQFGTLKLASCKLKAIPDLKNQSRLMELDLSDNQIGGEIPNWIWQVGDGLLRSLNLSHNYFSHLQEPFTFGSHHFLDLHSNLLHGRIPVPPPSVVYVDYSSNNFDSFIPSEIGNRIPSVFFFSISNNKVVGNIPRSICNASRLEVVDLSNNSLQGAIPACLTEISKTLGVLNLRRNNLSARIPMTFPQECDLQTLDLSENHLEGNLPKSLVNCTKLEVINLGKNRINDTFPCWLKNLSNLRVLVIRSNNFQGHITCAGDNHSWPNLQIMDLASNKFSGGLPPQLFSGLKAITVDRDETQLDLNHLHFQSAWIHDIYYQDVVVLTAKGNEMEWEKVLTIFTSIDFSKNSFQGGIPQTVGDLKSANVLDLSHNALTGPIPPSIGNLKQLESLDLSVNKLSEGIPIELASLTFLSFLNLSNNELDGMIPIGSQLQTFTESSFKGNKGLCGVPLNTTCHGAEEPILPPATSADGDSDSVTEIYLSVTLGFAFGLAIIFGPLLFSKRWRMSYNKHVDRILLGILQKLDRGSRNTGTSHAETQFTDLFDSEDELGWTSSGRKMKTGNSVPKKNVAA